MRYRKFLALALAVLALGPRASAQDVLPVDQAILDQHVDHRVTPLYPPIAKATRVQGTVVFEVRIGVTGKIDSSRVVSGPPMLRQAAIDCLKQWTYRPFEKDGAPIAASGTVAIEFSLGKDGPTPDEEKIASRYFPLSDQCRKAVSARTDYPAAAAVCKTAADTADEFPADRRFIEKRSAFVWAAYAFMYGNDLKNALVYAGKAVDVVKLGHDDESGSNAAYGVRGLVEGNLGELTAADQDLNVAEDYERKGIARVEKDASSLAPSYRRALVQDLRFHAKVLQGLNRPGDAQKKLDEAAKLN
ncbi:MAG: energy transducer TonB [Terracidiphilus sp.]